MVKIIPCRLSPIDDACRQVNRILLSLIVQRDVLEEDFAQHFKVWDGNIQGAPGFQHAEPFAHDLLNLPVRNMLKDMAVVDRADAFAAELEAIRPADDVALAKRIGIDV